MTIKGGVIAVRGHLPPTVVHSYSTSKNSKRKLAISLIAPPQKLNMWVSEPLVVWVNNLLGIKPYKGVKPRHPGVNVLADWVIDHYDANLDDVPNGELLVDDYRKYQKESVHRRLNGVAKVQKQT